MAPEDTYLIAIGRLASEKHRELTGETLHLFDWPCAEAIVAAQEAMAESERIVHDLLT